MFEFIKKINIHNLKKTIVRIFKRFPVAAAFSLSAFILMLSLVRIEDMSETLENNLLKVFITLVIGFFFSVAIYLFSESKSHNREKVWYFQSITLVFSLLYYFFFEENLFNSPTAETFVYVVLTLLGVVAFLFVSPFVRKFIIQTKSQTEFYSSSYSFIITTLMAMIVGVATMLLGFIAFTSTFTLFDIDFVDEGNWYGYWASFSLVLFAPYFFLANLRSIKERDEVTEMSQIASNKFYSFLVNFVGLPAILIYFLILYAYSAKVLMNFNEWPQGEVTWMVIIFSFFAYLIYFASYAFENIFKSAKLFRLALPIVVLLQTPMLFYAIGLRINQYDITINRYLVVVFGLWLFGLSVYFIASKVKNLAMIFYTLVIVAVFMSIGPWSVYTVPEWRQLALLESNLKTANILQDGAIVPLENYKSISAELSGEIYGGIDYLCDYHGSDTLNGLLGAEINKIKKEDEKEWEKNQKDRLERMREVDNASSEDIKRVEDQEYGEINRWNLVRKLTETIKVERWNKYNNREEEPRYLEFRVQDSFSYDESIEVSGFDYYLNVVTGSNIKSIMRDDEVIKDSYHILMDTKNSDLKLYFGSELIETLNIEELVINKTLNNTDNYIEPTDRDYYIKAYLDQKDMTFELAVEKFDMKLVLRSMSIKNPNYVETDKSTDNNDKDMYLDRNIMMETKMSNMSGYVLLKKKDVLEQS